MNLAVIAFTEQGLAVGETIARALTAQGDTVRVTKGFGHEKHPPLRVWAQDALLRQDGVVFIGAAGIAVRAVAPGLRGKQVDPAVVVVDEQARFAISLLSGHAGGANALAARIAQATGAQPVITTATDGRGLFAVDVWAKQHGLTLVNPEAAKAVSAALLAGGPVGFAADFAVQGPLPEGVRAGADAPVGLYVGVDGRKRPFATTLYAVPRILVLGIGCRRDAAQAVLARQADAALAQIGSTRAAVAAVHTIDRKADEAGLVALCGANGWPLRAFSADTLRALPGDFSASALVERTVGVDNVCERAAAATGGTLLLRKQTGDGVTVAIAMLPFAVSFEGWTA